MRNIIYFVLFLSFCSIKAQEIMTISKNDFNERGLIEKFFDASFNSQTNEFSWKPNFEERLNFGVSNNGKLYTKIDTILNYGSSKKFRTIVLNTFVKEENGEKENCHACSPILSLIIFEFDKENEYLNLRYFKKNVTHYGAWGEPYPVDILQFSEDEYLLVVNGGWSGQGVTSISKRFYYYGTEVLSVESYADNFGWTDDKNLQYKYETLIDLDKVKKTITLTKKGTEISEKTDLKVPVNKVEKYKFDEDYGTYIKICK